MRVKIIQNRRIDAATLSKIWQLSGWRFFESLATQRLALFAKDWQLNGWHVLRMPGSLAGGSICEKLAA